MSGPEALLPVGVDCECGFPMVWRHGLRSCAVYGSHPAPEQLTSYADTVVTLRNLDAPGAALINLVTNRTYALGRRRRELEARGAA
jgi:hypothetical protein